MIKNWFKKCRTPTHYNGFFMQSYIYLDNGYKVSIIWGEGTMTSTNPAGNIPSNDNYEIALLEPSGCIKVEYGEQVVRGYCTPDMINQYCEKWNQYKRPYVEYYSTDKERGKKKFESFQTKNRGITYSSKQTRRA